MLRRHRFIAVAAAIASLGLAACGDDEDEDTSAASGEATEASESDGGSGDTLALGEAATVGVYPISDPTATEPVSELAITVEEVREGTHEELADGGIQLDPEEQATTPYYVDVTYENTGDAEVTGEDLREVSGVDPDDVTIPSLTIISLGGPPFAECAEAPDQPLAPGDSAEGCSILLVPEGVELDRIEFFPGGPDSDFVYWDAA